MHFSLLQQTVMKLLLMKYLPLLLLQGKCIRAGRVLDAVTPCCCFLEVVPDGYIPEMWALSISEQAGAKEWEKAVKKV